MFDVNGYVKDGECVLCEKVVEVFEVTCKLGTLSGRVCPKCLLKQCKVRAAEAKKPTPANGSLVPEAHG